MKVVSLFTTCCFDVHWVSFSPPPTPWLAECNLFTASSKDVQGVFLSTAKSMDVQEKRVVQGADDKLGQFLNQDIEALANHRNVLRHSLQSCSSLVSPNLNKISIFIKICMQSTKLLQQS